MIRRLINAFKQKQDMDKPNIQVVFISSLNNLGIKTFQSQYWYEYWVKWK